MLDPIGPFFSSLLAPVRPADLLDMALVAAFLYAFITWLRQSTSRSATRRTLFAVTFFAAIYGLAFLLEMYLVRTLMEVLFVVLLLGAVVVFQSDIRRMVDRIGTWHPFRRTPPATPSPAAVNLLVEASGKLAESRTGALIALHGREPWDRYIEGGIRLDGKASLPLLYSIFNHDSPGHDGAVLMEGDRVKMFGVHLPLSSHLPEASQFGGTRHAAALGLAEVCDALVIVISEERGTISIAEHGQLEEMHSAGELKSRLSAFWEKHHSPQSSIQAKQRYKRALQTGLLSLTLSILLWALLAYRPATIYRTYAVPVELRNLGAEWSLVDSVASEVHVTLLGSEQAYRRLDASEMAVSLNLADLEEGENEFVITEDNLSLPSRIQLYDVSPPIISVHAQRQRSVAAPVSVQVTGSLPDSLELVSIRSDPDTVTLFVPASNAAPPAAVLTEPVDFSEVTGSTRLRRKLVPVEGVRLRSRDQEVLVDVEVRSKTRDPEAGEDGT